MAEADSNLSRTATTQVHSVLHGNNPLHFPVSAAKTTSTHIIEGTRTKV